MTHATVSDEWRQRLDSGADLHASERYDVRSDVAKQKLSINGLCS